MRKLGRVVLWIAGAVVAVGGMLLLALNLYVQSQGAHKRIQQELSQRLNTPLRLRQISITPWSGLILNGITIPQAPGGPGGNFLEAQSFRLRVKFWSLFSNRLVIRQVSLVKPEVIWAQNAAGKWRLPALPEPPKTIAPPSRSTAPVAGSSAQLPTASGTPAPLSQPAVGASSPNESIAPEAAAPAAPFTPEVRRVNLRQGSFTFLDSNGRLVAKFIGLDFDSSFRTATAIKGNASVEKISLRDKFFIEKLQSPLHYDPAELLFSNISAHAAGGELSGRFAMQLLKQETPFSAAVRFRDLDADKLMTNAGGPGGMIDGKVEGFLDATGKTADPNALAGKGQIVLRDGKLQQYSLLVALGQILQIPELMQLNFEQAQVDYHINPGVVTVDQLLLRSANIRLTSKGTISFSGKLRLNSQLALSEKVRRQLFAPIRDNFQPLNEPAGYAAIDFKVGGTVDRPKTNLMDKVVGQDLRDLGGVISSLFGGRAKKKKSEASATATPTPTNSATPSGSISPNENAPETSPSPFASPSATP